MTTLSTTSRWREAGLSLSTNPYRRVITTLYAWVYQAFGFSDWAVKGFNASLDVLNVALVAVLAYTISRSRLVVALSATAYALLPVAIDFSRTELVHTSSATVVLLTSVSLASYVTAPDNWRRMAYLALSGVFLGLCFGVHEDLMLLVPGALLCVLVLNLRRSPGQRVFIAFSFRAAATQAGVLLGATALVYSLLGLWQFLALHVSRASAIAGGPAVFVSRSVYYPTLFGRVVEIDTSSLTEGVFFACVLAAVVMAMVRIVMLARGAEGPAHRVQVRKA